MNIWHTISTAIKTAVKKVDDLLPGNFRSRLCVVTALSIAVASVYVQSTLTLRTATITDGNETRVVTTLNGDPRAVIAEAGVRVSPNDEITHEVDDQANLTIEINRAFDLPIEVDGETVTVSVAGGTVAEALEQAGIVLTKYDTMNVNPDDEVTEGMDIVVSRTTYREYQAAETIAYGTKTVYTDKLKVGETKHVSDGINGRKTVTYRDTLINGQVVETVAVEEVVIKKAVPQVKQVGTGKAVVASVSKEGIELDANGQPIRYKKVISGKCTAYSSQEAAVGTVTSTGLKAQVGVVAVNPNIIPYGTKLYIVSADGKTVYGYAIAGDTGGAALSNRIVADLYMDTVAECVEFGRRTMNVYILE